MKDPDDLAALRKLLSQADVLIQNFRPGVIERLGLDYDSVAALNPRLVYASISGYGEDGPWVKRPGQDLLAQSRSGVMWLNGDEDQGPVPFGLAIGDMLAGAAAAQGILAALVRRGVTGKGAHVETSLLEALVDFQFEVLTTHLNDGRRLPRALELSQRPCLSVGALRRLPGQGRLSRYRDDADRQTRRPARPRRELAPYARRAGDLVHRPRRDQGDHRPEDRDAHDRGLAERPRAGRYLVRQGAELAGAARPSTASRRSTCCRP